jgi:hypothetical protein
MRRISAGLLMLEVLASLGLIGLGVYLLILRGTHDPADLWAGVFTIGSGLVLLTAGVFSYGQLTLMHKFEGNTYRLYDSMLDSNDILRRQTELIHTVAENASMSEWVKKIVHREKDHEFLRDTIQASMARQDWAAAEHLIEALGTELGYAEEARQLRDEIARAREATLEEKVERALRRFDHICAARKWSQAARETARLQKLFPDNERIGALPAEIDLRRQQYKRQLLKEYDQAARNNDVEQAHKLLVELDFYLAPAEGAALKDSARGVFKAKLMQMGVQFSLAVADKQYTSAIEIGDRIAREFPNSRYAHEITEMLPHLKRRLSHEAE